MGKEKEKEIRIIGFYTNDALYGVEAKEFEQNLKKYGLLYHLYEIPPSKPHNNWWLNCAQKSRIIAKALEEFDEDILYLDVDARIVRKPTFNNINRSVPNYAIWYSHIYNCVELASGTIYFPNNETSRKVLHAWIDQQDCQPYEKDQVTLQRIYKNFPYEELHHDWINIESGLDKAGKLVTYINTEDPIVIHTQASRRCGRILKGRK